MQRSKHTALAIGGIFVGLLGGLLGIPFLAVGGGSQGMPECPLQPGAASSTLDDGSPTILGPSTLTVAQLVAWWNDTKDTQPSRLTIPIDTAIALYLSEGAAEGVRGDLAFAQSIVETGSFTNTDTMINNFAGIGHYDDRAAGNPYPDARTGIRAQIQLLKKFAAGNDVELANPDLGVNAGRHATTWAGLAGTWATAATYWDVIRDVYTGMLAHHVLDPSAIAPATSLGCAAHGGRLTLGPVIDDTGRAWSVPVDPATFNPSQLDDPHHDYPAWDLLIPEGTPVYAVTGGTVVSVRNWPYNWWRQGCGRDSTGCDTCGVGVTIQSDNGLRHTYCHNSAVYVEVNDEVTAGQQIALSGDTGRSGAPHLHVEFRIGGVRYCPQPIMHALYNGAAGPFTWTVNGCTF